MHIEKKCFLAPLTIIVGAYGSGKSEVSVNLSLIKAKKGRVYLADLDIINPYFRSADTAKLLVENGVTLISSIYAGTNVDVPAVPAEVNRIFADHTARAVLDIGGEDLGARIVGSLKPQLEHSNYELLMVVNPYRPFTDTPEKICEAAKSLETACKLKMSGFIYNPNLLEFSTSSLLEEAWPIMAEAVRLCSLPVKFAAIMNEYAEGDWSFSQPDIALMKMRRTILYPSDNQIL